MRRAASGCKLFYRIQRNREADFVVKSGRMPTAIHVTSERVGDSLPSMATFLQPFKLERTPLAAEDRIPV